MDVELETEISSSLAEGRAREGPRARETHIELGCPETKTDRISMDCLCDCGFCDCVCVCWGGLGVGQTDLVMKGPEIASHHGGSGHKRS